MQKKVSNSAPVSSVSSASNINPQIPSRFLKIPFKPDVIQDKDTFWHSANEHGLANDLVRILTVACHKNAIRCHCKKKIKLSKSERRKKNEKQHVPGTVVAFEKADWVLQVRVDKYKLSIFAVILEESPPTFAAATKVLSCGDKNKKSFYNYIKNILCNGDSTALLMLRRQLEGACQQHLEWRTIPHTETHNTVDSKVQVHEFYETETSLVMPEISNKAAKKENDEDDFM